MFTKRKIKEAIEGLNDETYKSYSSLQQVNQEMGMHSKDVSPARDQSSFVDLMGKYQGIHH